MESRKPTSISVLKLTCFIPSDVLQKNSAKETKAGSEVNVEMASGCKKAHEEIYLGSTRVRLQRDAIKRRKTGGKDECKRRKQGNRGGRTVRTSGINNVCFVDLQVY